MAAATGDEQVVEYWEDVYLQKYMGDAFGDLQLSQVDTHILYDGLDALIIKATGESTGVDNANWFKSLDAPDIRTPFSTMVCINYTQNPSLLLKTVHSIGQHVHQ